MAPHDGAEERDIGTVTLDDPLPDYAQGQSSRRVLMLDIPEDRPAQITRDSGDVPLLRQSPSSPSIVRQIGMLMRSTSNRLSTISVLARNAGYNTVADERGEELQETIGVDLTTLGGEGFEEHAMNSATPSTPGSTSDDETTDTAQPVVDNRPSFAEFRAQRQRLLGTGLDNGIRIRRTPSARDDQPLSNEEMVRRARTVRNIGQRLAQQRNQIVAVPEAVDLSLLEGTQMLRRGTDMTDDVHLTRSGTTEMNPQSYFFPAEDPKVGTWKPFSISTPFIISLTILALSLAGLQEYLCQWSIIEEKRDSGILAFDKVADLSVADFFAWKYLPTMVTIIYAVLFSIMDFDIRRLEPYYQLSQPNGSTAAASLNLDHLTMFQYLIPFNAIRLKQWAVAISTFGNILAATAAPALQNPSFNFVENIKCDPDCPGDSKKYFVRIDKVWSRLMTVSYIIIAIITLVLVFLMRRKSGLESDPKGIAGIASMATKSHILQDFKGLDLATRKQIHKRLAHRRFVLYKSSIWQGEWATRGEPLQESDSRLESPHPPMLRLAAAIPFIGYMLICLIFVPLITLTSLNVIPNKAPWAPILVATILKLIWSTFEADVRLIEPFYQLSKGNARPENSITLDYQATVYGIMPFVAVFKGHFLVALVGVCTVFLDILAVTAGSFSVSADITHSSEDSYDDETSVSFWTSLSLSIFILSFVIFTAVLVYMRRRHPFLPREPSTIAAVLAFIYASNMLDDFVDTEKLSNKAIEDRLKRGGKRYGLGYFQGRDRKVHCAIDEGTWTSKYTHGKPYSSATYVPRPSHEFYPV